MIDSEEMTTLLPEKRAAKCIITTGEGTFEAQIDNAQGELNNTFSEQQMMGKYKNMLQNSKGSTEALLINLKNIDRTKTFGHWLENTHLLRS